MNYYSKDDVLAFIKEEDVKFIRLAFSDVFGNHKNVSISSGEIERAFESGIAIDGSAIKGFGEPIHSDLFLIPDPSTLAILPWRPEQGKVVRMYSSIHYPDGRIYECDTRAYLKSVIKKAHEAGFDFTFGSELEFYLFLLDEKGERTYEAQDHAGYMDVYPEDRGENIRREICLNLERMGIYPECSHHEEGPGQNEIDFRYSEALEAADNAFTFKNVVRTIALKNGLYADFSAKPRADYPGNGLHINMSLKSCPDDLNISYMIAGIMDRIKEITLFLNPGEDSYSRLGKSKAPLYISWSRENRSQLIRVPYAEGKYKRLELRSPDPECNVYLAYALLIEAAMEGILNKKKPAVDVDVNLYKADERVLSTLESLPSSLEEAKALASDSLFVEQHMPYLLRDAYFNK